VISLQVDAVVQELSGLVGDKAKVVYDQKAGFLRVETECKNAADVAKKMKETGFDHCISVTAVDFPVEGRMSVVWHVSSYTNSKLMGMLAALTVNVERARPEVPSLVPVWESAVFHERETHEMFGVGFAGHPDLRQLLLPDEFKGKWPLRKDFKLSKKREDLFNKGGAEP